MKKIFILLAAISMGCSFVSPTATFSDNSFSGKVSELIDFDDVELKPTAQIGLIIDNSASMKEEQEKIATGIEKMIKSLKGFNVDVYTISTTALAGMHRINQGGNHGHFSRTDTAERGQVIFNPVTSLPFSVSSVNPDGVFFGKPFMSVEDIVVRDNQGDVRDFVPYSWVPLGPIVLPWTIDFSFKGLPSATNAGQPFKLTAEMSDSDIASTANQIKQEVSQFGISGSPDNYGACALYRMARDMIPAGKATSFFLISDGDDKSNFAVDTASNQTFEEASKAGLSYCSDSSQISVEKSTYQRGVAIEQEAKARQEQINQIIADNDSVASTGDLRITYDYNSIIEILVEITGTQVSNGTVVNAVASEPYTECAELLGLCDLPYIELGNDEPYVLNAVQIAAILRIEEAKASNPSVYLNRFTSISSAKITRIYNRSHTTAHWAYHEEDRRFDAFTHNNVSYQNILDYYTSINPVGAKTVYDSARRPNFRYSDNSGIIKKYPRSKTQFPREELASMLSKRNNEFSQALGELFIEEATAKFPAFSFSAIVHDELEDAGKDCGPQTIEYGTVYRHIAEQVKDLNNKSQGKVNSICESSYDEYIEDIKNNFIVKNASLSYVVKAPIEKVSISSIKIVRPDGSKTTLKLTKNISDLDSYDVAVVGESVTFNQEALKKIMGTDSIDAEFFKGHKMDVTFSPIK